MRKLEDYGAPNTLPSTPSWGRASFRTGTVLPLAEQIFIADFVNSPRK
jgi:hypothetical protein